MKWRPATEFGDLPALLDLAEDHRHIDASFPNGCHELEDAWSRCGPRLADRRSDAYDAVAGIASKNLLIVQYSMLALSLHTDCSPVCRSLTVVAVQSTSKTGPVR